MKQVLQNKEKGSSLIRYKKSFIHALEGMKYAFFYEHNMIIIIFFILLITILGIIFKINTYEWLFCITMFGTITSTELINTAIEAVVDLKTMKYDNLAKIAKDTASSATLVLCITSLIGGIIIFVPKIISLF